MIATRRTIIMRVMGWENRKRVKYKENKNANKDEKSSVLKAEGGRRSQLHAENDCGVKAQ